jgi:hypothetical protein
MINCKIVDQMRNCKIVDQKQEIYYGLIDTILFHTLRVFRTLSLINPIDANVTILLILDIRRNYLDSSIRTE